MQQLNLMLYNDSGSFYNIDNVKIIDIITNAKKGVYYV